MYDSRLDTWTHIHTVQKYLGKVINILLCRSHEHDQSKLRSHEKELFDKYTPLLKDCTYGSDQYKQFLVDLKPALDHHYSVNNHHPEFFVDGIKDMSLIELIEMICDWKAASERHVDGDIRKSIEINQKRFGYSDELKQIFLNTLKYL
jgi:hypothetical protein